METPATQDIGYSLLLVRSLDLNANAILIASPTESQTLDFCLDATI
ncbi:MAG: hypothetical protein AAGD25_21550 [Cyanobacteria bacterium P01_F01_bin.150]